MAGAQYEVQRPFSPTGPVRVLLRISMRQFGYDFCMRVSDQAQWSSSHSSISEESNEVSMAPNFSSLFAKANTPRIERMVMESGLSLKSVTAMRNACVHASS